MNEPAAAAAGTPQLTVGRYRLGFYAASDGQLPRWAGSTWRGAFGRALKQGLCVTGIDNCRDCPVFNRCAHAYIFETPPAPGTGKMRKYTTAPRPYVLLPDRGGALQAGDRRALEVRLFGQANDHASVVISALERAARTGLGRSRLRFDLETRPLPETELLRLDRCPPAPESGLAIHLLTPLRLRVRNRYAGPDDLAFGDFFSQLLRRISMLCTFHERRPFEIDFRALVASARRADWQATDLRLAALKRHSSRQRTAIDMSGLTGTLRLDAEQARVFWPWLWLGQHTLVGRGCVMGLGHYRLEPAPGA